jgi:uracil-DNA glycosylase
MSLTREDMLRELELLPAWQLRQPLTPPPIPLQTTPAAMVEAPKPANVVANVADVEIADVEVAAAMPQMPASREAIPVETATTDAEMLARDPELAIDASPAAAIAVDANAVDANVQAGNDQPLSAAPAMPGLATPARVLEPAPDVLMSPPWDDDMPPPDEMLLPIFEDDDHLPDMKTSLGQGRRDSIAQLDWQGLQSCVANCEACSLSRTRTQTVFGVGDPAAEWLIVGEAPGAEEDRRGEPFVGQAGQLLDNMLGAIQLKRGQNVYIANVLKCRPPQNRDPQGEEVQQCDPFLKRQVELIKPKLILALGKFAAQSLLNSEATIGSMRGQLHEYNGVPVIVTYHPAYLLRNLMDKAKAWEDLCLARATMRKLQEDALQSASSPASKD